MRDYVDQQKPEISDRVVLNGHHARNAGVTPSTLTPRSGVEEALRGPAGRLAIALTASSVLELPAGMAERTGTVKGDQLQFEDTGSGS